VAASEIFEARAEQSRNRLIALRADLSEKLACIERTSDTPKVAIYATGSLARLEATEHSDLDAFFFLSGGMEKNPLSRIRDVKILNAVVSAAENANFPDFSNEGEYLKFLHIDDVLAHLGGRSDDYHNAFTARMLMILESKHLYGEENFNTFRNRMVEAYFKDFHDHEKSFKPIFLLNDILRFWRTLCLNYENGRHWREKSIETSSRGHLGNLKLRFSRLNICYSFIAHLLSKGGSMNPSDVIATSQLTPIERLQDLEKDIQISDDIKCLLDEYSWFLDAVGGEKATVLTWISNEENRIDAFRHGQKFVDKMGIVVHKIAEKNGYLKYLII
jgi:hypothetical protein